MADQYYDHYLYNNSFELEDFQSQLQVEGDFAKEIDSVVDPGFVHASYLPPDSDYAQPIQPSDNFQVYGQGPLSAFTISELSSSGPYGSESTYSGGHTLSEYNADFDLEVPLLSPTNSYLLYKQELDGDLGLLGVNPNNTILPGLTGTYDNDTPGNSPPAMPFPFDNEHHFGFNFNAPRLPGPPSIHNPFYNNPSEATVSPVNITIQLPPGPSEPTLESDSGDSGKKHVCTFCFQRGSPNRLTLV